MRGKYPTRVERKEARGVWDSSLKEWKDVANTQGFF